MVFLIFFGSFRFSFPAPRTSQFFFSWGLIPYRVRMIVVRTPGSFLFAGPTGVGKTELAKAAPVSVGKGEPSRCLKSNFGAFSLAYFRVHGLHLLGLDHFLGQARSVCLCLGPSTQEGSWRLFGGPPNGFLGRGHREDTALLELLG